MELLLFFGAFSTAILAIITLGMQLRARANLDDLTAASNYQNIVLSLVLDGNSWAQTLARNNIILPTATTNPLTNPLADPPLIPPPESETAPFPTGARPFDLYDSSGLLVVAARTAPARGITKQGAACSGANSPCAMTYRLRWWLSANAANPLVTIAANLQIDSAALNFNSALYSFDNSVLDPAKRVNTITRHLFPSWVSRGLTGPSNPNLAYLDLSGVPVCAAGFMPGLYCGFNGFAGFVGRSCLCPTTTCKNGQELFTCQ